MRPLTYSPSTDAFIDRSFYMDRTHQDWETAWAALAGHESNAAMAQPITAACPFSGESWQYMGSYNKPSGNIHEFRHRRHPGKSGERVLVRVFIQGGVKGRVQS